MTDTIAPADLIAQVLADNYRNGTKNPKGSTPSRRMESVTRKVVAALRGAGYRITRVAPADQNPPIANEAAK